MLNKIYPRFQLAFFCNSLLVHSYSKHSKTGHLNTGFIWKPGFYCPVFEWNGYKWWSFWCLWTKAIQKPDHLWTCLDHLKTGLVRYLNAYCTFFWEAKSIFNVHQCLKGRSKMTLPSWHEGRGVYKTPWSTTPWPILIKPRGLYRQNPIYF